MDTAKFESQLKTHATALTLVDGSATRAQLLQTRTERRRTARFSLGKRPATRCSTAQARATPTWPRHGEACGKSPKLETDKTSSSTPAGRTTETLASWAAQEDIAETLKTLKEIAAAISASNKTHAAANCLHQLAKGTATLEDVALREACSAFAFDAWLAKWTTREQSTQKSGAAKKGAELPAPRSDESDNEATPSARTESGRGFAEDTRTQSRAAETASVAAPRLLATTLGLVRAAA
ncbi:hypothetical protein ERJ75_000815300 [Trypanosoma vivax]|nr:hypothetical protein ERJ75_000815300 [Trypanosoma vivax]